MPRGLPCPQGIHLPWEHTRSLPRTTMKSLLLPDHKGHIDTSVRMQYNNTKNMIVCQRSIAIVGTVSKPTERVNVMSDYFIPNQIRSDGGCQPARLSAHTASNLSRDPTAALSYIAGGEDAKMQIPIPKKALAIVAHPIDVEYFCAGTLSKWMQNGCQVAYVVASSGEKHIIDLADSIEQLVAIREEEQRASAVAIGVQDITFLRYPDCELSFVDHNRLLSEFVRQIRRIKPVAAGDCLRARH